MHKAKYFSGKTSKPYECLVKVESGFLWIYPDGYEAQQWPLGQIQYTEFKGIGKTTVRYGTFPFQTLEYEDHSPLAHEIEKFIPARNQGFKAFANELVNSGMKGAIVLTILVASALISVYFFLLPLIAEQIAVNIPKETEEKFGDEVYNALISGENIDSSKTVDLNKFASKINFNSEYNLNFTVVNSDIVNAFALPGGNVVVYSGIIDQMDKPEQLAALLCHEVAHINKNHSLKNLSREYSGRIFISFLVGDASVLDFIANQAQSLYGLKYSREMETEADLEGLKILQKNEISQESMIDLMKILEKQEIENNSEIPQYLSTHPISKNRIKTLEKNRIRNAKNNFIFEQKIWSGIKLK